MTMAIDAAKVGADLRAAYNSKDDTRVHEIIRRADVALEAEDVSASVKAGFWMSVRREFNTGQRLVEKQENSALMALMRQIEAALADRAAEG